MLTALRQTLIAARFMGARPAQPTNAEIRETGFLNINNAVGPG